MDRNGGGSSSSAASRQFGECDAVAAEVAHLSLDMAGYPGYDPNTALYVEDVGGTTYFYRPEEGGTASGDQPVAVPPDHIVYPGTPSRVLDGRAASCGSRASERIATTSSSLFQCRQRIHETAQLQAKALLTLPNPAALPDLPRQVAAFDQLLPLDQSDPASRAIAHPHRSTCYKATCTKSGQHVCLRRLHACVRSPAHCARVASAWRKVNHSNVLSVRDVFATKAFGDDSVVLVYDYDPIVESLADKHFDQPSDVNGFADPFQDPSVPRPYSARRTAVQRQRSALLPESLVWSYVVQLTAAVRAVHAAGVAAGCVTPECVLIAGERPRLAGGAVADVLGNAGSSQQHQQQQEDLSALGRLLLAVACHSLSALQPENTATALAIVERHFSADLRALLVSLLSPATTSATHRSINDVMPMIDSRFYVQLELEQRRVLQLEQQLAGELAAARIFRQMAALSAVTERPRLGLESGWAETGDRYMLKLFRDHVFHAVAGDGSAWPDLSHVLHSLNRLDVASERQLALASRDSNNVLVTSYAELHRCLDASFTEISNATLPDCEQAS